VEYDDAARPFHPTAMFAMSRRLPTRAAAVALILTASAFARDSDRAASDKALQEAIAALEEVRDDALTRTRLWCDIAEFRRTHGDRDGAVAALDKAKAVAELGQEQPPVEEWRRIGQGYARLGDAKAVLGLADRLPPKVENRRDNPQLTLLQEGARSAAEAGQIKAAEQIAEALPDGPVRKSLREAIARQALIHQAAGGDAAGAIKAATKLPTAADTVFAFVGRPILGLAFDDDDRRPDGIAPAQLAAGDHEGAAKTARSALALLKEVDAGRRAAAVTAVVRMLARLDDVAGARQAMGELPAPDAKAGDRRSITELLARGYLAAAEVRAGHDDAALALAKDLPRAGDKAYVLHFTALAQARAGRKEASAATFAKAVELVTKTPDADGGGTTLHNIASAQAAAGDFAGAAKTAALQEGGTIAWANLAHYQVRAGDFDGARKAATDHLADSSFWSAAVLEAVAEGQARAGQGPAVRQWIAKLDDPLIRAHALFGLAKGLAPEAKKKAER
jgi:tetratricopeptide (TPR) repeat protein